MLKSSNWMIQIDDRILEDLRDSDEELTAWAIAYDLDVDHAFVRHRCATLTHAGFLDRVDRDDSADQYCLTIWGALYLSGDVDADLRRPNPRPRPSHAVRPGWYAGFG